MQNRDFIQRNIQMITHTNQETKKISQVDIITVCSACRTSFYNFKIVQILHNIIWDVIIGIMPVRVTGVDIGAHKQFLLPSTSLNLHLAK